MTDLIEKQIADALETVLPNDTWPVILPQNPVYPAVTYHRRDYQRQADQWSMNPLLLRSADGPNSLFQVVVYSKLYTDAANLLRSVKSALEGVPGLQLDSVQDGYEYEQQVFAIITEWRIWGDLETSTTETTPEWLKIQPFIDAIVNDITATFDDRTKYIGMHTPTLRNLPTPAIVLDMEQMEPGIDPGDGRTALDSSLSLHCLIPQIKTGAEIQVRSMAAEVAQRVNYNKWGLGDAINYPENLTSNQDTLSPGASGYTHWVVSWNQTLYITPDRPDPVPEFLPDECYSSFEPAVGEDFEDDYELLEPTCDE